MNDKILKIGVDLRPLLGGKVSGVENYIKETLTALLKLDQRNHYYFWVNGHAHFEFPAFLKKRNTTCFQTHYPNKFLNLSLSLGGFPKIDRFFPEPIDVFWMPDPRPVAVSRNVKLITTFHDLSPELCSECFNFKTRLWHKLLNLRKIAQKSDRLIAVSGATRRDLMKHYNIAGEKIEIIYEAPVGDLKPARKAEITRVCKKYKIEKPYLLTLSTLEPRKNLEKLILGYSFARALLKFPYKLVVAGINNKKIFAEMPSLQSEGVIFTGFIPEEDKSGLYTGAEFFINVSLLEGFGLPVAEAVACGTPCLVSGGSSLTEVAGKAGVTVDPKRVSSIARGIQDLVKNPKLLSDLRKNTKAQAKKFSWEKTAEETLAILTN